MSSDNEVIKKQCQYCRFLHLNKCTYDTKTWWLTDGCLVFEKEIERVQGYFETVIIPARIAEAKKELLAEIEDGIARCGMLTKNATTLCKYSDPCCSIFQRTCTWWQSIKELKI